MYHVDFVYYTAVTSYNLATMTALTASLHAAGMFSFKQLIQKQGFITSKLMYSSDRDP